jgi:hypothetical protein
MQRNMKGTWEEAGAVAVDWLPPAPEWDFRSVREKESRLACCWEYERQASRAREWTWQRSRVSPDCAPYSC